MIEPDQITVLHVGIINAMKPECTLFADGSSTDILVFERNGSFCTVTILPGDTEEAVIDLAASAKASLLGA